YDMTVGQTMQFYAKLKKVAVTDITPILERVGLAAQVQKPVKKLSGGMKQRLALAVSLLGNPPLLLFDEPTANLDTQSRQEFLQLVHTLNHDGKTILFSTHRPDEVLSLATRVLGLRDGQVILDGSPDALLQEIGLSQWLRMWIPPHHWQAAIALLSTSGFRTAPNGHSLFVQVGSQPKISALRLLETAQIPVEDFDVVDSSFVPEVQS
ncbi:MAG: ABC transporter ATP-binding protein, partial [Anaerolineae bacterium]